MHSADAVMGNKNVEEDNMGVVQGNTYREKKKYRFED